MEDSGNFIEKMLELGIGLSMVKQMPEMLDGILPESGDSVSPPQTTNVPPPLQKSDTYLVIDKAQAGPFSDEEITKLIKAGCVEADTLVWKPGMASWLPAKQVPDIQRLFVLAKLH